MNKANQDLENQTGMKNIEINQLLSKIEILESQNNELLKDLD